MMNLYKNNCREILYTFKPSIFLLKYNVLSNSIIIITVEKHKQNVNNKYTSSKLRSKQMQNVVNGRFQADRFMSNFIWLSC